MRFTTARTAPDKGALQRSRLLQGLVVWYAIVWIVLAISPIDRSDWLLENILAICLILVLVVTYRKFPFSDLSYLLIAIFMTLHAVGAHYTYSEVPIGFWLKDALGLSRNHFDRIVHFAFGLLLAYPIRELLIQRAGAHDPWSYVLAVTVVQACSDLFEIIESWVALLVEPDLGNAYLGTQGDEWDAQRDMTAAFTGAVLGALATYAFAKSSTRKLQPAT
jgi:putative membrane protein